MLGKCTVFSVNIFNVKFYFWQMDEFSAKNKFHVFIQCDNKKYLITAIIHGNDKGCAP